MKENIYNYVRFWTSRLVEEKQKMDERNKRGVRAYDWPKKKPEPRLFIVEQYSNLDCDTQCVYRYDQTFSLKLSILELKYFENVFSLE